MPGQRLPTLHHYHLLDVSSVASLNSSAPLNHLPSNPPTQLSIPLSRFLGMYLSIKPSNVSTVHFLVTKKRGRLVCKVIFLSSTLKKRTRRHHPARGIEFSPRVVSLNTYFISQIPSLDFAIVTSSPVPTCRPLIIFLILLSVNAGLRNYFCSLPPSSVSYPCCHFLSSLIIYT